MPNQTQKTGPIYVKLTSQWKTAWMDYLAKHNVQSLLASLTVGLDAISVEYLERMVWLYDRFFNEDDLFQKVIIQQKFAWCSEDIRKEPLFDAFMSSTMPGINAKYHLPKQMNAYLFFNKYCLKEINEDIKKRIKGKTIIDGGAFIGDSAVMFCDSYAPKNILAFEPVEATHKTLLQVIDNSHLKDKIIPICKGIGDQPDSLRIRNIQENATNPGATFSRSTDGLSEVGDKLEITTIDHEVMAGDYVIGLIKLDIEGFEKKAIEGALEIIKRDKPVLIISLYHNPVDFFEIKPLLESLNLGYKYMVRRSETIIPLGDVVLIAY